MTQHWYSTKVCDGCGKVVRSKDGQRDTTRWLHLSEFGEDFLKDGDLDYVDRDFCTNECLQKWANEQVGKEPALVTAVRAWALEYMPTLSTIPEELGPFKSTAMQCALMDLQAILNP